MMKKNFLHKLFGTNPADKEGMQPREALSYSVAGLGQNLICGLVGSYISYYFTNGLLLAPTTVGIIMLIVRVFDATNDPIMGSIIDRTHTKYGKCRPFLLWMPIPIAISTVTLFLPLPARTVATTWIMSVLYLIWSVLYTIVDVPYWGLASSMTSDTNQRGTMLTVARLFCTAGGGIISILVPNISGFWIKNFTDSSGSILQGQEEAAAAALRANYWWLALVIVIIATPAFFIGFKYTKERYQDNNVRTLGQNIRLIFKNKPLMLIVLSGILGSGKMLYMYSGLYFAQYNLTAMNVNFMGWQGTGLFTIITLSVVPGGLIASLLVPWCTRKWGKRNTFLYSHLIGAIVMFVMYFVGWKTTAGLVINLVGLVLLGIPQGFANIITYAIIADSVDYLEWKEGVRAEGICFAMQTFINKIGMAIGAAFTCFGLGWAGINAADATTFAMETNPKGLDTLFLVSVLIPAISMLLSVIPLFFYNFTEKKQAEAVAEVNARKAAEAETAAAAENP
ncbi:MAG TPA: glycoside-pentoside-hexuronide (GPH):cation symporter [Clostridia bacterium]|nr:glycoside-pentoside-hexuronide (GPH):cation symporter [Clostridia bacterium]